MWTCLGLDLGVTEKPADHRQAFPHRQRPGGVPVTAIVKPHVLQPGAIANDLQGVIQIAHRPALDPPRDHERIARHPRDPPQHPHRFRRQRDRPRAGLGVRQPQLALLQRHRPPLRRYRRRRALARLPPPRTFPRHDRGRRRVERPSAPCREGHPPRPLALPVDRLRLAGDAFTRRRPPVARRAPRRPGRARPDAREDRPARARPGSS